jgi:hypothetical protein
MPKLIVNPGSPTAWQIQLKPGTNLLGRGFANDFKIEEPSVSGSHCQIVVDNDRVLIKDLGSTNGTYVNRAPVKEAQLEGGQTIHLGGVPILFESDSPLYPVAFEVGAAAAPPPPIRVAQATSYPTRIMAAPIAPPPVPTATLTAQRPAAASPPASAVGSGQCKFHPKTAGRYFCSHCNHFFCELCVTTRPVGGAPHKFCRACGTELVAAQVRAAEPVGGSQSFYRRLPSVFIYPLRGMGTFVMIVCTMVIFGLGFISAGWLSIFAKMAFFGYLFSFMQNIIHSTAAGDEEVPGFPPFDDLFGNFLRFAGAAVVAFGVPLTFYIITIFSEESTIGSQIMIPSLVLGCLYFPMALLAVAMKDTPLASNPLVVLPAIFKVPLEYLLTVILLAAIMGLRALGEPVISAVFPRGLTTHSMAKMFGYLGAWSFWNFAEVYLLAVNMRILGLLYLTKKHKLAWFEH